MHHDAELDVHHDAELDVHDRAAVALGASTWPARATDRAAAELDRAAWLVGLDGHEGVSAPRIR